MTPDRFEPFFIPGVKGRLFALLRAPMGAQEIVILVPPFGEEMNKSRKQLAEITRDLVAAGMAVLQFDYYGTGDSDGEFDDADWATWKQDLLSAIHWSQQNGFDSFSLIALRLGCILAAETLLDQEHQSRMSVFIQPVTKGTQFTTQFLRLRVAASMMSDDGKESVDDLRRRLADGEVIEVSGYPISGKLINGIEAAALAESCSGKLGGLHVIEIGRERADGISPAGKKLLAAVRPRGVTASGSRVPGEPFWTATEIVVNDDLRKTAVNLLVEDPGT